MTLGNCRLALHICGMAQLQNTGWQFCGEAKTCYCKNARQDSCFGSQCGIFLQNLLLQYDGIVMLIGIYPRELRTYVYMKICTVYSSFLHHCQNSEIIMLFFSEQIDKQTVEYPDNGMLFHVTKEISCHPMKKHRGSSVACY